MVGTSDASKHIVTNAEVAQALRAARKHRRLSQRALGERVGLPQSHISKIESAEVDPKLTTLLEVARALELELMLVPRQAVPAVLGIVRIVDTREPGPAGAAVRPAYTLDEEGTEQEGASG